MFWSITPLPLVVIPLTVIVINDFVKCLVQSYKRKKFDIRWMFHSWGMPSGHSSLASSVVAVTLFEKWTWWVEFMIAAIFWLLVMYDARGIRSEASFHAKILNNLQKDFVLDELLGHNSYEVAAWAILGFLLSYFLWISWLFT